MITEDYVSFEMAKLLKEKGFDEKCRAYYKAFPESRIAAIYHSSENRGVSEDDPNEILCPTLQMAMKWLRETHNTDIIINVSSKDESDDKRKYAYAIVSKRFIGTDNVNRTYEEACEAGIRYCLENLI